MKNAYMLLLMLLAQRLCLAQSGAAFRELYAELVVLAAFGILGLCRPAGRAGAVEISFQVRTRLDPASLQDEGANPRHSGRVKKCRNGPGQETRRKAFNRIAVDSPHRVDACRFDPASMADPDLLRFRGLFDFLSNFEFRVLGYNEPSRRSNRFPKKSFTGVHL